VVREEPTAQIIDLFEALKRSLAEVEGANDAAHRKGTLPATPEEAPSTPAEAASTEAKPPRKAVPRKSTRGSKPATG
jgi:hypothetical protein